VLDTNPMKETFNKVLACAILVSIISSDVGAFAQSFGEFLGAIRTEWLGDGRKMRLLSEFQYIDPKRKKWIAPVGSIVDGASIPKAFWSIIGGPFEGKYRAASVIHDVACDHKVEPWESVHEAFYWAMRASGVEAWKAKVMFAAVYSAGPRWSQRRSVSLRAGIPVFGNNLESPRHTSRINDSKSAEREIIRKALEEATPGSTAEVVEMTKREGILGLETFYRARVDIRPPAKRLDNEKLLILIDKIKERENSPGGDLSLEEIRSEVNEGIQ
jgi:hypothetical protein